MIEGNLILGHARESKREELTLTTVTFTELIHLACSINNFLLTSEEGMAL